MLAYLFAKINFIKQKVKFISADTILRYQLIIIKFKYTSIDVH